MLGHSLSVPPLEGSPPGKPALKASNHVSQSQILITLKYALENASSHHGITCPFTPIKRYAFVAQVSKVGKECSSSMFYLESFSLQAALPPLHTVAEIPPFENILYILEKCKSSQNLVDFSYVHLCLCSYGLEAHGMLGNHLVPIFVACRSLWFAHQLFTKLTYQNEYSWTSLLRGYAKCGQLGDVFGLYDSMQMDCVQPSQHTFVVLLKACTDAHDLERGEGIYSEIAQKGLERNVYIGNTLIDMFAKCGAMLESENIFNNLVGRDIVSWNALITGYTESGLAEEALKCFEQMQSGSVFADGVTYVGGLKACTATGDVNKGFELHNSIIEEGFETDIFIGNTLLDMYGKYRLLFELGEVFKEMENPDVVSWTSLIGGYSEQGCDQEAIDWLQKMQEKGVPLSATTLVFGLKAFGNLHALEKGQEMYTQGIIYGFDSDLFVGNTLVDVYAKCGVLEDAKKIFGSMLFHDAVSWNAIIAGYVEHNLYQEALNCLQDMQLQGFSPDHVTYLCFLKVNGIMMPLDVSQSLHKEIICQGFDTNTAIGIALVEMYSSCGAVDEALIVLDESNVDSWNAFISGCADQGLGEEALDGFVEMHTKGVCPNVSVYGSSLKACGAIKALASGFEIHYEITKRGYDKDPVIKNNLIDMYGKCSSLLDAQHVFDRLWAPNTMTWNVLIAAYAEQGSGIKARTVLEHMQLSGMPPCVISWNMVINGYGELEESEVVFGIYAQLQEQGVLPDITLFISILKACVNTAALSIEKRIHASCHRYFRLDALLEIYLYNALIDIYCKSGNTMDSCEVFDCMHIRTVMTWNILITGYACRGQISLVFKMLEQMRREAVKPDDVTFLSILNLCVHAGLLEEGQRYLEIMTECRIPPNSQTLNCMIDLLGQSGQLIQAVAVLERASPQTTHMGSLTLLGACQKWGNVGLGRKVFDMVRSLDSKDVTACVMMSSIYIDAQMWERAEIIDEMRSQKSSQIGKGCLNLKKGSDLSLSHPL